ncbi:MAG: rhodanese-like domain-containing protein [Verrucomicrobiales bacterium]
MGVGRQIGAILSLALAAAILSAFFHPKRPAWRVVESTEELRWQISLDEAKQLAAANEVLWIDARSRETFEDSSLPNAILLNTDEWGDLMFEHMDVLQSAMDRPVVVYCDGTRCAESHEVATRLRELLGLEPVYVLKGDWRDLE